MARSALPMCYGECRRVDRMWHFTVGVLEGSRGHLESGGLLCIGDYVAVGSES